MNREKIVRHLIGYSLLVSLVMGLAIGAVWIGFDSRDNIVFFLLIGVLLVYPVVLTLLNLFFLFKRQLSLAAVKKGKLVEYITIVLGVLYSLVALPIFDIKPADWDVTLINGEVHTPLWSGSWITLLVIGTVGICGYFILSHIRVNEVPPLISVCAIAAMYLGVLVCVLWIIQVFGQHYTILCLFPFNCIVFAAKAVRYKVEEWKSDQQCELKRFQNKYLEWLNQKLLRAELWPVAGFVLMWPLLGIIILILTLFGQQPDSVIKGWTETSDWNLSNRVAPLNLQVDEHYLCTVAAGGHEGIVKPVRMGERHGHRVVVNRQLCIANAFEQVLEERVPVFHRQLRNFYDRYGFPVAKLIRSRYTADLVYIIMKPLEWIFLAVIYFCDVNPENRIAVQYLPAKK